MVDWGLGSEGGGACARVRVCVCVRMRVGGGAWRCVRVRVYMRMRVDVCVCGVSVCEGCVRIPCFMVNTSGCAGCKRAVGQQWGPHCLKHRAKALV